MKTNLETYHFVDTKNEQQITSEMEENFKKALIEILG